MKKLTPILILSILFLSFGFSQQEYNSNDLIRMDNGLWTEKFSDEPITGKVYGYYGEDNNLKKVYVGNIRNGKREGKWVHYYHSTGKKIYEQNFKDGKPNGLQTRWYENGKKKSEGTYKDGKTNGLSTSWYENGQKETEVSYRDGKEDGLWTNWYENGQKSIEGTFKDGYLISNKLWNEDGSVYE
jgi:antitoxin component YwqK of YwqJK toxin-antitoxin module